jgi:hypothetical protein
MATSKKTAGKEVKDQNVNYGPSNVSDAIANKLAEKGIGKGEAKEVTSSTWKWEDGVAKYFRVLGLPIKQAKRAGSTMEPPTTMPVKNLDTGDHCSLLVNTMLGNQLASFSGDTLLGKCFISCRFTVEGKTYKGFETILVPTPEEESNELPF